MIRKFSLVIGALIVLIGVGVLPVIAQDGSTPATHVVQPGENLFRIALHYNISLDTLMAANGLSDPNLVVVGQTLVIPGQAPAAQPTLPAVSAPTGEDVTYTVAAGERLLQIARRYGVSLDALIAANHLVNPDLVVAGQVLIIPGGSAAAATTDDPAASAISTPALVQEAEAAPDLGILPATADELAASTVSPPALVQEVEAVPTEPALSAPDLGILSPGAAEWLIHSTILTVDGPAMRKVYLRGLALGNNPHAFAKIGDCNSEPPFFLTKFDRGEYDLGMYDLQPVIDHFAGSFGRTSAAVWTGNHAWAVFDATWSNPALCQPGETPIECEFRVQRPSLVLIRLGTNEAGQTAMFEENLRKIIEFALERGVIPVLGTKADQLEGSDEINDTIRALAAEYDVPLWDFAKAAATLPNRGLQADGFHMTWAPLNYGDATTLNYGHPLHNLTALLALDAVWHAAMY